MADHIRSTYLDLQCLTKNPVTGREVTDPNLPNKTYVCLTISNTVYVVDSSKLNSDAFVDKEELSQTIGAARVIDKLRFVPYYYKANRSRHGMVCV